jgi:hypothetical protein
MQGPIKREFPILRKGLYGIEKRRVHSGREWFSKAII